jgi:hypothetical protein
MDQNAIQDLINLPETGMGFQIVEARIWGATKPLLVFNASEAIDISQLGLEMGQEPDAVLKNGLRIINAMQTGIVQTMIMAPGPTGFNLLNSRIPLVAAAAAAAKGPVAALPSSLVKTVTLTANRVFHRFSAYNPDRRVNPTTGNFVAGTYAAPASEVPYVPTGFVAVGRFALPLNLPASHHYEVEAPVGTLVHFGTVAPAFGQAGGGVEAFFPNAVTNAADPPVPPLRLPDE